MRLGLDVGSTTIKYVVLDEQSNVLCSDYQRHYSHVAEKTTDIFADLNKKFPGQAFQIAVSGSAGMGLAEQLALPFAQEVFATRIAAAKLTPGANVVLELGGEDAKVLFLTDGVEVRMNGTCAGGTGAFIDQMATLLKLTPEELNKKAKEKEKTYTIASRCGVFAKSDIQPLLNQGARVEDMCSSILFSVVNQTIAGLAQGRAISGKVLYLGGPLTFMDELRKAFDKVLGLQGYLPEHSLYFVAVGAALSAEEDYLILDLLQKIKNHGKGDAFAHGQPLFADEEEYELFLQRHQKADVPVKTLEGYTGRAHLGIDAGSTTCKTALISEEGELLHTTYTPSSGNPLGLIKDVLLDIYHKAPDIIFGSVTTTGYGELLCKEAFQADYSLVETMAHFRAAKFFLPNVDFIIDIGGQDMKCFKIEDGVISDIFLNEACSSGCGSFLQTFAQALGWEVEAFAKLGLFAKAPVELGSRCTVFMNSSVKQAQKDGASIENISAGLAMSVVKNALYKVIRVSSAAELGEHVVVQGGTFYNNGVLRAFEQELGREVVRPSIAGLMGAFGAALFGRKKAGEIKTSSVLTQKALNTFGFKTKTTHCGLCTNHCLLTINTFSYGNRFISGNRCDRPVNQKKTDFSLDIYAYKTKLLRSYTSIPGPRAKIGIPMGLNFFETLPFWHTLFTHLGFEVVLSPPSSRKFYFKGQGTIPSDTVCYPAKLMHGHIYELSQMEGVDTIFYPCMSYNIDEGIGDQHFNCPVVAYYPEVIKASCKELDGKLFIYDYVGIHRPKDFVKRFTKILAQYFCGISERDVKKAADDAYRAYDDYLKKVRVKGEEIIQKARQQGMPVIVLAGRPYHADEEINHGINQLIAKNRVAIISEECVSHYLQKAPTSVLNQWTYHARLYSAARYVATQKDMHLVQLVSFGCGLDAVTTDEVRAILHRGGKLYAQIKIDEISNLGAVNIRLRSLFSTLEQQGEEQWTQKNIV